MSRWRTPSWDMEGVSPNSTTFPASRRRVQWSCPSGGGLQAKAIRACPVLDTGWASPRSSNFRGRLAWGRSCKTLSNPSSTKRCLTRYTVQGHIQSFGHLGRRPTVVALQENPRSSGHSGCVFANPDQSPELFPLFLCQLYHVFVPHHHCHPRHQHFPPGRITLLAPFLNKYQNQVD